MKLQELIHVLSTENSALGEFSRDVEKDEQITTTTPEKRLKEYLHRKTLRSHKHAIFVELLFIQEIINHPNRA